MDFREVDRRYVDLKRQYDSGSLSDEEFDAQLKELMVQDGEGRWWAKSPETGEWHYYDGSTDEWIRGTPPDERLGAGGLPDHSAGQRAQEATVRSGTRAGLWIGMGLLGTVIAIVFIAAIAASLQGSGDDMDLRNGAGLETTNSSGEYEDTGEDTSGLIFEDDFSSTDSGWPVEEEDSGGTHYADGGFHIYTSPDRGRIVLIDEAGTIEDVLVEVDGVTDSISSDASWGIICRALDFDNLYMMEVEGDGDAVIHKYKNAEWSTLDTEDASNALREGGANHIRGDCVGSTLTLYVNGQQVAEAEDEEFGSGQVGLYAEDVQDGEVLFDDFVVSTP